MVPALCALTSPALSPLLIRLQQQWQRFPATTLFPAFAPPDCLGLHARRQNRLSRSMHFSCEGVDVGAGLEKQTLVISRRAVVVGGAAALALVAAADSGRPAVAAVTATTSTVQPPASVLVIGAGGATGGRIVKQLLERGYKVKAGVRDVEKAKAKLSPADGLSFVRADVTEEESAISEAIGDAEAVIVATGKASLNPGDAWAVDNLGTQKVVDAARKKGVKKFVLISSILTNGAAIGQIFNPAYLVLNIIGGGVLLAKLQAERHIKSAGVDYTIVRPGGLSNDPPAGNVVTGSEDTLTGGRISRDLVAQVAVEALLSKEASNKVVEVIESTDAPKQSFDELFAACKNAA